MRLLTGKTENQTIGRAGRTVLPELGSSIKEILNTVHFGTNTVYFEGLHKRRLGGYFRSLGWGRLEFLAPLEFDKQQEVRGMDGKNFRRPDEPRCVLLTV